MQLLRNATESIQIGVEDFEEPDDKRHLSAVRNIYAGILLLYKHLLAEMSPSGSNNVLIKKNILPQKSDENHVQFVGAGNQTVGVHEIQRRFKNLRVHVDWQRFKVIQEIRNDIEHFYTQESAEAIKKELFSHAFVLINDFITRYISEDPSEVLGKDYWTVLLENNDVFEAAKKRCYESLQRLKWPYESFYYVIPHLRCPQCNSTLIKTKGNDGYSYNMTLCCEEGNHEFELDEVLESAVHDAYDGDNYIAAKDGCGPVTETCPECSSETYIIDEDVCLACGSTRPYKECQRCGNSIPVGEQHFEGYCSYCDYVMSKDD